jgi:hypothetical protein
MIKRRRGDGEHPRTRAGGTPSAGETKSERDKVPRALRDGARKRFFFVYWVRHWAFSSSLAKQRSGVVVMAAKAQVSSEAKKNEDEEPKAGELLFCGGSNWEAIGKKQTDGGARGIFLPTRLAALQGIDIAFVASGSGRFPFSVFLSL